MADYSTYDKNELLKVIAKQEKELKAKKYGLVWDSEREPEQVVLDTYRTLYQTMRKFSQNCLMNLSERINL
ncbi:MAG: hypothetical protein ACE5GV_16230 [Candidatus Scalindua sp.]